MADNITYTKQCHCTTVLWSTRPVQKPKCENILQNCSVILNTAGFCNICCNVAYSNARSVKPNFSSGSRRILFLLSSVMWNCFLLVWWRHESWRTSTHCLFWPTRNVTTFISVPVLCFAFITLDTQLSLDHYLSACCRYVTLFWYPTFVQYFWYHILCDVTSCHL